MNPPEIRSLPAQHVAAVRHLGPYFEIGAAFEKLIAWAIPLGVLNGDVRLIGIYYDNPECTPAAELKSDACLVVDETAPVTGEVVLRTIPGGKHAVFTHLGPYTELPNSYRWIYSEWVPASGEQLRPLPSFEIYLDDPSTTPPDQLRTEICLPLV